MSPPVEDNAADTLPRASHSPNGRVGGRTADPVRSEFGRTQKKKGYWAFVNIHAAKALTKEAGLGVLDETVKQLAFCTTLFRHKPRANVYREPSVGLLV